MKLRSSSSAASAACLSLVVGIALAAGAARAAPSPGQPAPSTLARGLRMLRLWGAGDRYVYFSPLTDEDVAPNLRAPKAGGKAQPIAGLPERSITLDGIEIHGDRLFMLLNREAEIGLSHDLVSLDESGGSRTVIARDRRDVMRAIVLRGHVCWIESAKDKEKRDPEKLTLFCADRSGRALRPVWHGPDDISNVAALGDDVLLFMAAPMVNSTAPNGWATQSVAPGAESSILRISPAGGTPKALWKQPSALFDGAVDGDDVYACTEAGLIQIATTEVGKSTRLVSSCERPLTVWHGWRFRGENAMEPQPIKFARLEPDAKLRVLFPKTLGMGVAMDGQAVYACIVSADPTLCDLRRIDAAELEAQWKRGNAEKQGGKGAK